MGIREDHREIDDSGEGINVVSVVKKLNDINNRLDKIEASIKAGSEDRFEIVHALSILKGEFSKLKEDYYKDEEEYDSTIVGDLEEFEDVPDMEIITADRIVDTVFDEHNLRSHIVKLKNGGLAVIIPINKEFDEREFVLDRLEKYLKDKLVKIDEYPY